ncbi:MAG: hypothetical protein LBP63_05460 [Prevotellaceae bacterium]|jgi:hypothetical protein|nr:hypothetical protein [Prevotellaceae bacterium]
MKTIPIILYIFTICNNQSKGTCADTIDTEINYILQSISQSNKIYNIGCEWTYSYEFIPNENKFSDDGITFNDINQINNVKFNVVKHPIRNTKDTVFIKYSYPPRGTQSVSLIIENDDKVWIHPPRDFFFRILEINPFPYIKKPYMIGSKWTWDLTIGSYWGDARWKEWNDQIVNQMNYEITGDTVLQTSIGKLKCFVIKSSAKSEIGTTYLTAFFNETYGFVELYYTNIDSSKLILKIEQYKATPEAVRWQIKN